MCPGAIAGAVRMGLAYLTGERHAWSLLGERDLDSGGLHSGPVRG